MICAEKESRPAAKKGYTMQSQDKLGTMPIGKLLIVMSVPMMISMLVQALYNTVDSMFVAHLSEDALTAVSLAFPFQNIMNAVAVGSGLGVNALVSRSLGQGNRAQAERTANVQMFLSLCYSVVFAVLGAIFARKIFAMQTDNADIVAYGEQYLSICSLFAIGMFYGQNMEKLLIATGNSVQSMVCQAFGAVVNIILDPILIFGLGPIPSLGVAGAAWATVIGQFLAALLALGFNLRWNKATRFRFAQMLPNWKIIRMIFSVGIPSMLTVCLSSIMSFGMNTILLTFSTTAAAVFGVWLRLQYFAFMPVFGLNNGTIAIYSYNFGAGNFDRVRKALRLALLMGGCFTAAIALFYELCPRMMLGLFDASDYMLSIGVPALRICGISLLFGGLSLVFSSSYQSLGYSGFTLLGNATRQMILPLPLAFLLSRTGVLTNVWFAVIISETLTCLMSVFLSRYVMKQSRLRIEARLRGENA